MLRTCSSCGGVNRIPPGHLADRGRCGRCKAELPPSAAPIDVADAEMFDRIIAQEPVPVLVDFWAAWCGPCRMVAPEVARTAAMAAGSAVVLKVDTERLPALSERYRVQAIPNFAVFHRGKLVQQRAGALPRAELLRLIEAARAD